MEVVEKPVAAGLFAAGLEELDMISFHLVRTPGKAWQILDAPSNKNPTGGSLHKKTTGDRRFIPTDNLRTGNLPGSLAVEGCKRPQIPIQNVPVEGFLNRNPSYHPPELIPRIGRPLLIV